MVGNFFTKHPLKLFLQGPFDQSIKIQEDPLNPGIGGPPGSLWSMDYCTLLCYGWIKRPAYYMLVRAVLSQSSINWWKLWIGIIGMCLLPKFRRVAIADPSLELVRQSPNLELIQQSKILELVRRCLHWSSFANSLQIKRIVILGIFESGRCNI